MGDVAGGSSIREDAPMTEEIVTDVCVVGGGPGGVMLGLLLARAGIHVVVLEKHVDFFRDFRGDTVHPSTLNLIDQLGIREPFERVPHTRISTLDVVINGVRLLGVDLRSLPKPNRQIALMPQWDLLDLLAEEGRRHPSFRMLMGAEAMGVHRDARGRVAGVIVRTEAGELTVRAGLTIAADGRSSTVREAMSMRPQEYGVPIDVLWLRMPKPGAPLPDTLAYISDQSMIVTIPRPDYLQCGLLIPKGTFGKLRAAGMDAFHERIAHTAPPLREVVGTLTDWTDVKLLSVQINRLSRWSADGVLFIGDAAHAMSPAFGVGINYAVQDAVAAANILVPMLRSGPSTPERIDEAYRRIEERRARPTARMQRMQMRAHAVIANGKGLRLFQNGPARMQRAFARSVLVIVRPLGARLVGYGFRPERIDAAILNPDHT
jgi:2-polyprenyl-6-methoxyphenol hydroxylase-like FAD-dependent oxidoreductase